MRNGYRIVREGEQEPAEWCWNGETRRLEPLEHEDPSLFRAALWLAGSLAIAGLTWGVVTVIELVGRP